MSIARDRDAADARDHLRRAARHTRDAEARADLLAAELTTAKRDLAASRADTEFVARELRQARRDLAARDAHDQRDTRRPAGVAHLNIRAQADASLARLRRKTLEAKQEHSSPTAADLLNALGPIKPPIPAAPVLGHPSRLGADDTYLSREDRILLLQQASDSDSPGEETGTGRGSPADSHTSSSKRRDSCPTHSSDGSSPVSSRRRHASPAADFTAPGSARGP